MMIGGRLKPSDIPRNPRPTCSFRRKVGLPDLYCLAVAVWMVVLLAM